jgi:hypothetical protein
MSDTQAHGILVVDDELGYGNMVAENASKNGAYLPAKSQRMPSKRWRGLPVSDSIW